MAEPNDLHARVTDFIDRTLTAMGIPLAIAVEDTPDSVRFDLSGDGGEVLLRRRAEALDALQHIVNTAYRRKLDADRTFVLDCLEYRKGKDAELKQMARFVMEKAKTTRTPQEIGPLNPYARRLVHMTVAEDPEMTSESIGDAFLKTVIISRRA
jgi:spoIIIJ-associated protein